jgi:hypothetical protein
MFHNRKGQNKRKATRRRAVSCLHGNKSIDASIFELTFDPNVVSPVKRRRLAPIDGSTKFSAPTIKMSYNYDACSNPDLSPKGQMDNESDKENTPFLGFHSNKDMENKLFSGSYIQSERSVSYLQSKSEMSTQHEQLTWMTEDNPEEDPTTPPTLSVSDFTISCSSIIDKAQESKLEHLRLNKSTTPLYSMHHNNKQSQADDDITSCVDTDKMADLTHLVSAEKENKHIKDLHHGKIFQIICQPNKQQLICSTGISLKLSAIHFRLKKIRLQFFFGGSVI